MENFEKINGRAIFRKKTSGETEGLNTQKDYMQSTYKPSVIVKGKNYFGLPYYDEIKSEKGALARIRRLSEKIEKS